MKHSIKQTLRPSLWMAATGVLLTGSLASPTARAADPYDKSLEARVAALERELNAMDNDSKGKNTTVTTEVPTFVRASKNVQELVFSGELRFRYDYSNTGSQADNPRNPANGRIDNPEAVTSRNRFRFRLFADYKLSDNTFAGAAVQTAPPADSGNTTFTEGFDNYALYLWRFFVGYKTKDDSFRIVAGKQPNPFYLETEMLWDADISPTGLTEQYKYPVSSQLELGVIAGQFFFYDNTENAFYNPRTLPNGTANPNYVRGGDFNDDAYLLYQQVTATFKATNKLTLAGAGGYLFYAGHGGTNSAGAVNPNPAVIGAGNGVGQNANQLLDTAAFNSGNATRNLSLATVSADARIDLGALKLKVYGDGVYNFKGNSRVSEEYGINTDNAGETNKFAFATGLTLGSDYQIKKKGDYLLLAEYRQVGLGSVDPNLNDSDFNVSRLGFRGIKGAASYGFTPYFIFTVTYFACTNLGENKNVNVGVSNINSSQTLFVDLTARF